MGLIRLASSSHGRREGNPRNMLSENEENARDVETHFRRAGAVGARKYASNLVDAQPLPTGHYLQEEAPDRVVEYLLKFMTT